MALPLPEDVCKAAKLRRGSTWADLAALGMAKAAVKGRVDAAHEIADRVEGKARQTLEVSGPEGGPLDLQFMTDEQLDARIRELLATWEKPTTK